MSNVKANIADNKTGSVDSLPSNLRAICIEAPLYKTFNLTKKDCQTLCGLKMLGFKIESPCVHCGKERTFIKVGESTTGGIPILHDFWLRDSEFEVELVCSWNDKHKIKCFFVLQDQKLTKIGQFPSIADIAATELNARYRKILGQARSGELSRAIGLAAHGIGIGSLVYLRRVFESILEDHRKKQEESGVTISNFDALRIAERIDVLKTTLPPFLVKHKDIYGILSTGVHELDEQACLKYFPIIREAIFLILHQDAEAKKEEDMEKALSKELGTISQEIQS